MCMLLGDSRSSTCDCSAAHQGVARCFFEELFWRGTIVGVNKAGFFFGMHICLIISPKDRMTNGIMHLRLRT